MTGARDHGFTLIETIVTIVVSSVVLLSVGAVLGITQRSVTASATQTQRSRNEQLSTLYLNADLQSAGPNPTDVDTSGTVRSIGCGDSPVGSAEQPLTIQWTNLLDSSQSPTLVAYRHEDSLLRRYSCDNDVLSSVTVGKQVAAVSVVADGPRVTVEVDTEPLDSPFTVAATRGTPVTP